mgnify:CR=1 FL=1
MGNRVKAWNVFGWVVFLLVFAASVGVFWFTRTGEGFTDFIINMVFAVIAAMFLIIYFAGSAGPLARVVAAMSRVTDNIRRSEEDAKTIWNRYSQNAELFENARLDERWGAYLREVRRLQKQSSITADCRIGDYIDEEFIYATVNKSFCDQLGGIMSGLGILFTFIGLVYGLRNFDASTVDVMQTSTQALMAGIKIAFLTSIFGLIYSLLFGLFYKRLLRDSLRALYEFQDEFSESVRPVNEHAADNAMIRLQMEQNAALQQFGTNIGDQVSEAIITLMKPTVDTLQRTISQYVTVAIEDQRAGMEKVVRYFLDSMNTSLGNIFVQLKNRTEELARWEQSMIDSISLFVTGLSDTNRNLTEAEAQAIHVFGANLKQLLLQPPIKDKVVLALDPGFRTGCKVAVIDGFGKVLDTGVIYPVPPHNKVVAANKILTAMINKHNVNVIAIGNGTASRESEQVIVELLKELDRPVQYVIVNEAGASVYSASKLATEEFPQFDVGQRSAASIARRLQDPLAELVKIDPKAIGVGQYQHDLKQNELTAALDGVVEQCVNQVGVEVSTASAELLSHVAGIGPALAKNIVAYREENGIASRAALKKKGQRRGAAALQRRYFNLHQQYVALSGPGGPEARVKCSLNLRRNPQANHTPGDTSHHDPRGRHTFLAE